MEYKYERFGSSEIISVSLYQYMGARDPHFKISEVQNCKLHTLVWASLKFRSAEVQDIRSTNIPEMGNFHLCFFFDLYVTFDVDVVRAVFCIDLFQSCCQSTGIHRRKQGCYRLTIRQVPQHVTTRHRVWLRPS